MATKHRQKIVSYDQRIADRIKVGMIVGKMQRHIEDPDKTPMLATQLRAAQILLNKVVPDVQSLKIQEVKQDNSQSITTETLKQIIQGEYKVISHDPE